MYTFLLLNFIFFGLLGGKGGRDMRALLLLTNGQRRKNTASLARGIPTKRGPDRFRARTCVQTAWSVEPLRVTRSVSNSTPGKYLSLADITFSQFLFSFKKEGGVWGSE